MKIKAAALMIASLFILTACATPAPVEPQDPAVQERAFIEGVRGLSPVPAQTSDAEIMDFGLFLCDVIRTRQWNRLEDPTEQYTRDLITLAKATIC